MGKRIKQYFLCLCILISACSFCSSCGSNNNKKKIEVEITIECKTILDNIDDLNESKEEFVPDDGMILDKVKVEVPEGSSVFDVLLKVCKENKIQIESSTSPVYKSVYVEGINQLYEFDCGPSSGWLYSVNGVLPNYGCDKYDLKDGDVICFYYTVTLGDIELIG